MLAAFYYSISNAFHRDNLQPQERPFVSVLIPAWNEEVGIMKTIHSVLASDYSHFEVIVINDGSTDKTHALISDFLTEHKHSSASTIEFKYLKLQNGGKAKALNAGIQRAGGEIIVTLDADSIMDPQMISNMVNQFQSDQVAAVAGNVIIGNRRKPIEFMQQLEYLYGFFFKRADSIFNSVYIIGGAAAAYRKHVLDTLGGFDDNIITEDIEMSTRILSMGYKTRYAADAVVYTEGPSDWKSLCNQRLRWKFGRLLTFIKHKKLFFSTHKKHNPYLSFLVLPIAIYSEFLLLFEGILLSIFYGYTIYTFDYFPLVIVVCLLASVTGLQILLDSKRRNHMNLILLAPVAWIVFYFVDLVEFQALCRSLKKLKKREELQWQKWVRVGISHASVTPLYPQSLELPVGNEQISSHKH